MELTIKKANEEKKYVVCFAKQQLEVSETSETWNNEGINQFLIQLATKTPDGENIEIKFDENLYKTDKVYKHVVELFNEFVKKFNEINKVEDKHVN